MSEEVSYLRQLDFFNPNETEVPAIHILGCGGIGSFVGANLGQMGIKSLVLWDRDAVEAHNIPNQNFSIEHIGMEKTDALAKIIKDKNGFDVTVKRRFFTEESHINDGIVVTATDSIASRKLVWADIKKKPGVKYFVDGRLGGQAFQIFVIDPNNDDDIAFYESTLFGDDEADPLPCTARAVIYVGTHIAALMTQQIKCLIMNEPHFRSINVDHLHGIFEVDGQAIVSSGRT